MAVLRFFPMDHALRSLLWFLLVPLPVAYGVPTWIALSGPSGAVESAAVRVLGLLSAALGTTVLLWCFAEFVRRGHGTPAPYEPPRHLVAGGLYRYSRNPMYVSVVTVVLGEALWWGSMTILAYAGLLVLVFHGWVVLYEEPSLRRRFGQAYETYCVAVPRWLGAPRGR